MKKIYIIVLVLATIALSALGFAACDSCDHAQLEHRNAIEPGCETDGNIEYWFCRQCGQYFSDEGKTKIAYADVVIGQLGHDMQDVQAVDATCYEPGNTSGKQCSRCDMSTVQMVQPSHDMIHHDEIPATCAETGVREHWTCSREDGVYYANEKGTATISEVTIPVLGHDMTHHDEIPATCTETGEKEYWTCSRHDGVLFANEEGSETYDDLTTPATGHKMTHVDLLEATCTQDGHVAHWVCANETNGYYLDEDGNEKLDSIVLDAIGHDYSDEWAFDTTNHWHVCKNGCDELVEIAAHIWDEGEVTIPATTKNDGETFYNCEVCDQTMTKVIPMLKTFTLDIEEIDLFNNEDGGSVYVESDTPLEDGKYVEGSIVYVTIVLNETYGLGAIHLNDDLIDDMPLATNGEYTFSFKMRRDTTLSVEFGKLITSTRTWKLYKSSNNEPEGLVDYPWDFYRKDAASDNDPQSGKAAYGSLMLYVYDATGIDSVRAHDFTADPLYLLYAVDGDLKWSVLNKEINVIWLETVKYMTEENRPYNFTLAFAMRLLPSEVKRGEGYVGSNLILPTAATVGGVSYDMTMEYNYTKANASAPNSTQIGFNDAGTSVTFLREAGNNGFVFNTYHAAYVEVEMRKGDEVRYAYLFVEGTTLYMYSNLDKSGNRLSCGSVTNAYVSTSAFDTWAFKEYPDVLIAATTFGWEFRTRIHVDEDSVWLYDGDWSSSVTYIGFNDRETPSFAQMGFSNTALTFIRTGGPGKLFTAYHAAYVEIELTKGDTTYYMYLFYNEEDGRVYMYANDQQEGDALDCNKVTDAYVYWAQFNTWASNVFEANFDAKTWAYRTKVHVDGSLFWTEDGEWSEIVTYNA